MNRIKWMQWKGNTRKINAAATKCFDVYLVCFSDAIQTSLVVIKTKAINFPTTEEAIRVLVTAACVRDTHTSNGWHVTQHQIKHENATLQLISRIIHSLEPKKTPRKITFAYQSPLFQLVVMDEVFVVSEFRLKCEFVCGSIWFL